MTPNFIVGQKPPNWDLLVKTFKVKWEETVVTYGNNIYSSKPLPKDLQAHETIHVQQQSENTEEWWDKYIKDPEFRLSQEIEAYRGQMKYIKGCVKDRNIIDKARTKLAGVLSSAMYGECITFTRAYQQLL